MVDEVFLEGMRFYAYHGVNPEERVQGQRFTVDVRLATDTSAAGASDDLADAVNYSTVFRVVRDVVEGRPMSLLEAVAEEIASALLTAFSTANGVVVTVRKPEAPIKGAILDAAGVTIRRARVGVAG